MHRQGQRILVRPIARRRPHHDLRREVVRRSHHLPEGGQRTRVLPRRLGLQRLDQAEVHHEDVSVLVEHDVRRLHVAMHIALHVHEVQGRCNVRQPAAQRSGRHRTRLTIGPGLQPRFQASPRQVLHHDVGRTLKVTRSHPTPDETHPTGADAELASRLGGIFIVCSELMKLTQRDHADDRFRA